MDLTPNNTYLVDNQTKLDESLEQNVEMLQVFCFILGGNEDMVQVDKQEITVHQPLHSLG